MKDFDTWSIQKKELHTTGTAKLYHSREVWWCILGVNVGFEQDGSGSSSSRPVLILKGFSKYVCLAIPLTTSAKTNPYHFPLGKIDTKESFAILSQLRLIDTRRLVDKICFVSIEKFEEIKKAVRDLI